MQRKRFYNRSLEVRGKEEGVQANCTQKGHISKQITFDGKTVIR